MKYILVYLIAFAISLAIGIYNISGVLNLPTVAGVALVSCITALVLGTICLAGVWLIRQLKN